MMFALLAKELRGLKAAALLIIGIELLGAGYMFVTEFPDHYAFTSAPEKPIDSPLYVATVFGVFLGAGLLRREALDGTLHFLDGLPLSRTRLFLAKMIAGWLVLSVGPLLDIAPNFFFGWLSRNSVDSPFPWAYACALVALFLFACLYSLSVTAMLAYLGKYFGFSMGLVFLGAAFFQWRGVHWIASLNPTLLLPHMEAGRLELPWRLIRIQGGITIGALLIAWLWFHALGARSRDAIDHPGRLSRVLLFLSRLATPLIWIAALYFFVKSTEADRDSSSGSASVESTFASRETQHYQFLYRKGQQTAATPLMDGADATYEKVAHFFAAPERSDRIVADLASPMPPHFAGVTVWTKIRARLTPGETEAEFHRVLGHETAHVLMQSIAGKPFARKNESTRAFNEGMATVVEENYFGEPQSNKAMKSIAAAVASRGPVPFSLLCDDEQLTKKRDPDIVYPLGSVFCRSLLRICGENAPARLLAEFPKSQSESRAKGEALWREVFQDCHYSLDTVVAAYDTDLNQLQADEADFLGRLPRLSAEVEVAGDKVNIHPKYDGTAPGKLVCCIDHPSAFGPDFRYERPAPDGSFHIPRADFSERKIRYMLGWSVKDLPMVIFEPWAEKVDDSF